MEEWKGCCRHCHRGVTVCGPLNEDGFCSFCVQKGWDRLPEYAANESPEMMPRMFKPPR